jgi:hypothetical protein
VQSAAGAPPQLKPCARAAALAQAGFLDEALAAYKADLGHGRCAIDGVKVVKAKLAKQAASPQAKLDATKQFKKKVALIRRLEAAGFEADARTKTKKLVSDYPKLAIPKDIRAVDQPVGLWRRQQGRAGPEVLAFVELAIVVLGGLLVVLVAIKVGSALWQRVGIRYTVASVTGPVAEDAAGQGEVMAAELARMEGKSDTPVRRVQATEGDFSLPAALTDAYPQAGIIAALLSVLDRVLPRSLLTISAAALPVDPIRGVGVTVTIAKRGGRRLADGTRTLWESEFGPVDADGEVADRLARLMLPTGVWLGYSPELVRRTVPQRVWRALGDPVARSRSRLTPVTRLGTTDWLSYAHFAVAERAQRAGFTTAARRGYFRALDVSLANIGARLNLAGLLLHRPVDPLSLDDPGWRLGFAAWLLEDESMIEELKAQDNTALRWRWLYLRAARALAAHALPGDATAGRPADRPGAPDVREDEDLLAIQELSAALSSEVTAGTAALAAEMRWPAFVLRRSILLDQRRRAARGQCGADAETLSPEGDATFRESWWTANTLYNLACYHARAAACHPVGGEREASLDRARDYLRDAIDRAAEPKLMLAMATSDPALDGVITEASRPRMNLIAGITDPSYEADEQAGHALGVRIREAIAAALPGSETTAAPAQDPTGAPAT